ncbi:MAG: NAD(P)(+) transhydrogenase (Re/Si-specific) subunit beta, partial [bacterium]
MSLNVVTLLYLVASVCFIQALKGLSNPKTARTGNTFGMVGMAIAILTTIALIVKQANALGSNLGLGLGLLLVALVIGGAIGAFVAARVEMTKMPELVAAMHSLIGLAAVCIAYAVVSEPAAFGLVDPENTLPGFLPYGNRIELFIGTFVGAITFSGSVIAFGKLSGKYKFRLFQGAPVVFAGQHMINLALGLLTVGAGLVISNIGRQMRGVAIASIAKLALAPLLAFAAARFFELAPMSAGILVLFAAQPTATTAYILARRLGGNGELMAAIIALQTLLAALTLPLAVAYLMSGHSPLRLQGSKRRMELLEIVLGMLVVAVVLARFSETLRVPYAVLLVVAGMALA